MNYSDLHTCDLESQCATAFKNIAFLETEGDVEGVTFWMNVANDLKEEATRRNNSYCLALLKGE